MLEILLSGKRNQDKLLKDKIFILHIKLLSRFNVIIRNHKIQRAHSQTRKLHQERIKRCNIFKLSVFERNVFSCTSKEVFVLIKTRCFE